MFDAYIITLANSGQGKHRDSARQILPFTLSCCQQHHWNVTVVDAINGYALEQNDWYNFGFAVPKKSKKQTKFGNLLGAQGCFLSHYQLWKHCVTIDRSIIVLEDDAEVLAPIPNIVTNKDLIKLHDPRHLHQHEKLGSWAPGAFAYWLTPDGAQKLITFAKTFGPGHTDKLIGSNVLDWGYLTPHIVKLGPRIGSSTNPVRYPYNDNSMI
jgi:hypothetical protein